MTISEIERLESGEARVTEYQRYIEKYPNHPIAWFNLAIDLEGIRDYKKAVAAAQRVHSLSRDLYPMLPARIRELAGEDIAEASFERREIGDYRLLDVAAATESHVLYRGLRISDGTPVTIRRVLDLSHDHARHQFKASGAEIIEDVDGTPLAVLPRIRGVSLSDAVAAGPLDLEVAIGLVRAVAEQCAKLHARGQVHADLRLEHIMRDARDYRSVDVELLGGRFDPSGPTPWGRFPFRSPEEDAGNQIDARTDVYGLGLLLYQLASSHPLPSLDDRNAGRLQPVAPDNPSVDALIKRCLSRDPAARFQTARELIDALTDLLAFRAPSVIGGWRIGQQLGAGTFGRVYAADNVSIDARAAVKILDPLLARQPEMRERFLAEAKAANAVEHPNIVGVSDGGTTPDGTTWLAMDLVEGPSLERELRDKGAIPPARAASLGAQVASALAAAHDAKLVHRDVKPGNLLIASGDTIKVLDFGAALLRGPTKQGGSFTLTGHLLGTPAYMAPEQWRCDPEIDGRADVYGLGCVLYECIAGRPPFSAETQEEWRTAHLDGKPPELKNAPPRLAALVKRMLAKRAADRPSAREVEEELKAIAREPDEPKPVPPRRRRWLAAAVVAPIVPAVGLIAWYALRPDPVNRPVTDAAAPADAAVADTAPPADAALPVPPVADDVSLWLDATDLHRRPGATIASWRDLSGNNNHAEQRDPSKRPTILVDSLTGHNLVHFDEQRRDLLVIADNASLKTDVIHVFIVVRSAVAHSAVIGYPHTTWTSPWWRWTFFHANNQGIDVRIAEHTPPPEPNDWKTLAMYSYSTQTRSVHRNGKRLFEYEGKTVTYAGSTQGLWIGNAGTSVVEGLNGDIGEILIYRRTLTEAEQRRTEEYLMAKWKLADRCLADCRARCTDRRTCGLCNIVCSRGALVPTPSITPPITPITPP